MTAFVWFYYALVILWLPLLWPVFRVRGRARAWLLVVAACGLAATAYEVWRFVWAPAAIRLDILLISVVLLCLYASAAAVLFPAKRRKAAAVLVGALVMIGGGMTYEWVLIGRESARLTEVFRARTALLFPARFRDAETYRARFGPVAPADAPDPVGHWEATDPWHYTRLVVSAEGRAWLFHRCEETECAFAATGARLEAIGDAAERRWQATLRPRVGAALSVRLARDGADGLRMEGTRRSVAFALAPPPIDPAPVPETLVYLGSFAGVTCRGPHATVRQLWLWRDDVRLRAVGVFSVLVAGRHAGFVTPVLMGEGVKEGDAWSYRWRRDGRSGTALVTLTGTGATLTLSQGARAAERAVLTAGAVFRDEAIELAPLTSGTDWAHWFAVVLVGHFTSGDVPAC
jgi:hypothetical protein